MNFFYFFISKERGHASRGIIDIPTSNNNEKSE